jgi:transaldolase
LRFYLATVAASEITWASNAGLIDGIVATPSVLAAELPHADPREVLAELAERTQLPIFASAPSLEPAELLRAARALQKSIEHLILAIPFVEDSLPVFPQLAKTGTRIAATLVHSVAQALLAAKAGASMVVIPVDAIEAVGELPDETVRTLRSTFDRLAIPCDIVVAGPANPSRLSALAAAGADAAVVSSATLRAFLQHPLTDRGIDRFLGDVSRRARPRRTK